MTMHHSKGSYVAAPFHMDSRMIGMHRGIRTVGPHILSRVKEMSTRVLLRKVFELACWEALLSEHNLT